LLLITTPIFSSLSAITCFWNLVIA